MLSPRIEDYLEELFLLESTGRKVTVTDLADRLKITKGTVTATVDGDAIESGSKVDYGTEVTLTPEPASGYFFIRWSDGEADTTRTITADTEVKAIFKNEFIAGNLKYTLTSDSTVSVGKIDDDHKPTDELVILATVTDADGDQFNVTALASDAFKSCADLTKVTISNGVKTIGSYAFSGCKAMTEVVIPNSVTLFGVVAFNLTGLTSVTIPNSVNSIGSASFANCHSLTEIILAEGNQNYTVVDGVLYNKSNTLIQYPAGKADTLFVVPANVKLIDRYSCQGSLNLKHLVIQSGVTEIGGAAFGGCSNLQSVILPSTCSTVSASAFSSCSNLTIYCQAATAPSNTTGAKTVLTNCKAIKVQSNNTDLGTVSIRETGGMGADGSMWFAAGTEINLVAEPAEGFELARWTVDGETVVSPYTVTKDAVINAEFVRTEVYVQNRVSLFSVGANQTICFAPGNLQYNPAKNTWRFAEHQYDRCFETNASNPSAYYNATYDGWFDLFGWGTSGYNDKMPYMYGGENTDYGDGANDIAGTNYDWGVYNSISGYAPGVWRTPTYSEWRYLIKNRPNADSKYGLPLLAMIIRVWFCCLMTGQNQKNWMEDSSAAKTRRRVLKAINSRIIITHLRSGR